MTGVIRVTLAVILGAIVADFLYTRWLRRTE